MGRVFHIGRSEDGNFAVSDITQISPEVSYGASSSLRGKFGAGYDESAEREAAMTNFPVPGNNNSYNR